MIYSCTTLGLRVIMNVVKDLLTVIIVGDGKNIPAQLVITGEETVVQKTGAR